MKLHSGILRAAILALAAIVTIGLAAPAFAQEIKRETAPITRADSGSEMYHAYCASCHGTKGKGDGPAAPALKTAPSDLTQMAKKYQGTFPKSDLEQVLTGQHGMAAHGTSDMPIWGHTFTMMGNETLRIHNLSQYIESLQAK
jgi:mono/diheme cytochrome c family protein